MPALDELRLRERLDAIDEQLMLHQYRIANLKKHREEVEIALQLMEKFEERSNLFGPLVDKIQSLESLESSDDEIDVRKPAWAPTVPEMIIEALQEARTNGKSGLEPKEMTAFIRDRYWKEVVQSSVGPIAWRMATKERRLTKAGGIYSLPGDEASAAPTADASEWQGGADSVDLQ